MESLRERNARRKRLNGKILESPLTVYAAFRTAGERVFTDGALSKKHKELMALAVAVSGNCFD